eukprot:CAMPEP_0201872302 /NCGR_PEP_ID=MMETSP0902-20130614/5041_1 /ASSEMBLY_ACC=CAM_ASM_000551 /TAXON_ID=420261 /ORGANISM="Thalassiosira antarctica, Strain CCMP982" /LENGTH=887 /DNA_ID=CAMNT_0048398541 /DNA_START=209 /DNA_END=2872 /DNA_ORIENTATION=+
MANDAASINSDFAVADGIGGAAFGDPPAPAAAAALAMLGSAHKRGSHINSHARQRHYRKRALSTANSSGTIESSCSMNAQNINANNRINGNGPLSSVSLMNSSTIGSQFMNSEAEHSIVSFGLNFNFDGASSPSNSDSGGKGGGDAGSSGEDDNNGNANANTNGMQPAMKNGAASALNAKATGEEGTKKKKKAHKHHRGDKATKTSSSPENSNNGSNEGKKSKGRVRVKFGPNCTTGANAVAGAADAAVAAGRAVAASAETAASAEAAVAAAAATPAGEQDVSGGSSTSSGSDSGMNDRNDDSGGSASGGSNSENGKSTVSSLTTSSNQGWMATNESAAAAAEAEGAAVAKGKGGDKATGVNGVTVTGVDGVTDGKSSATKKKDALSGKKRKMASTATTVNGTEENNAAINGGNDGEDGDPGYKTDEEQWGGNRNAATTNRQPSSVLKASSKYAAVPPMKQARFSIDQHPENVRSVDASAQMLSSLSGSDSNGGRCPAGTSSSGGGTPGGLASLATTGATSSNPSSSTFASRSSGVLTPGGHTASSSGPSPKLCKAMAAAVANTEKEPDKRKERNAREKERSCRIAKQIDDLRTLLSRGGIIVSKGTKSSVLSEAANYINILQQQQVQWEMDRQALMQQMQQIGAAPNNMGQNQLPQNDMSMAGVMPNVMDIQAVPQQLALGGVEQQGGLPGQEGGGMLVNPSGQQQETPQQQNVVNSNDYKFIFNNSSVGMAIASLGGAFIDCNSIFCQLSEYTKEEVCAMTIFNVTSRQDLQHAFDLISQMITPTLDNTNGTSIGGIGSDKEDDKSSIVLRGAMKTRSDLGLSISLIKGEQGIAKCFCVTLVKILSIETTRPDTVSIEMELPQVWSTRQQKNNVGFGATPAYTSG